VVIPCIQYILNMLTPSNIFIFISPPPSSSKFIYLFIYLFFGRAGI
jgi:hypothetical protein